MTVLKSDLFAKACTERLALPDAAFIDPSGQNAAEVKKLADVFVNLALEHRSTSSDRPIGSGRLEFPFDVTFPREPLRLPEIRDQVEWILRGSMNTHSPRFLAHMGACTTTMSVLGDMLTSAVNNNMIGLEMSPTLSLLEEAVARCFATMFGLPGTSGGLVATGGSLSNLQTLAVARNAKLNTLETGIHGLSGPPVAFASAAAHASMKKNGMLVGLGTSGLIPVPTDRNSKMDPGALRDAILDAKREGRVPFYVAATAGTTVTGNIDPIEDIGSIATEFGLWFHVDAAWGGGLQLSGAHRHRLRGIESADSITFCPQKMLLVALSSSLTLFSNWRTLTDNFRVDFKYLRHLDEFVDRSELGIQGSRPGEVLKLWLSMLHVGSEAYESLVDRWVALADAVATEVSAREAMELASMPESAIVCFRSTPQGLDDGAADIHNTRLLHHIHDTTGIYLSGVRYQGKLWLRAVFQDPYVQEDIVATLFRCIDEYLGRVS